MASDLEAMKTWLERDPALANVRDDELESTPLILCAHRGALEQVRALLAAGAELDAREGCSGATALHWAAESGHVEVARELLDAGAALELRDAWHLETPLGWCTHVVHSPHRHADRAGVAALLRERGARPSIFAALATGDLELAAELARDPEQREQRLGPVDGGCTPLLFAAERGLAPGVGCMIEASAGVATRGQRGLGLRARAYLSRNEATLVQVEASNAPEDLSYLLVAGREDEAGEILAATPGLLASDGAYGELLHALVHHGLADAVRLLLEAGADANGTATCLGVDEWLSELPPLFIAASRGTAACAEHLIASGAEIDARGMRAGVTPLHVAALRGHRNVVKLLLERGANPRARDERHGSTPGGWARDAGHVELATMLDPDA